jgi:AcrR family transcriptional regulator
VTQNKAPPKEPWAPGRRLEHKTEHVRQDLDAAIYLASAVYDGATMRAIADAAGVSVRNACYHFQSKDHLIQAYYVRSHEQLAEAAAPVLAAERTLRKRLHERLSA